MQVVKAEVPTIGSSKGSAEGTQEIDTIADGESQKIAISDKDVVANQASVNYGNVEQDDIKELKSEQQPLLPSALSDRDQDDGVRKALVLTDQGSDVSSVGGLAEHNRKNKLPKLSTPPYAGKLYQKGTDTVMDAEHIQSCASSVHSLHETPVKFMHESLRMTIDSQPAAAPTVSPLYLNQDLPTTTTVIPGQSGKTQFQLGHSPSRGNFAKVQTARIHVETQQEEQNRQKTASKFKGSKFNMMQRENMLAVKGVDKQSPSRSNSSQLGTFKTSTQQQSPARLAKKKAKVHYNKTDQKELLLTPFENTISGTQLKIQASPANQFINKQRKRLAGTLTGNVSPKKNTQVQGVQIGPNGLFSSINRGAISLIDNSSADEAPEDYDYRTLAVQGQDSDEKVIIPHQPALGNAYQTHTEMVVKGDRGQKRNSGSKMHKTQQSPNGLGGGSFKKTTSKNRLRNNRLRNTNMSKDLIAVLSDQSAENSSYHNKAQVDVNPSMKRGSAITFFDDTDNEADDEKKRYEQMNATLDTFERPDQQTQLRQPTLYSKPREISKSPQPRRYNSKKSITPNKLASPKLNQMKQTLIDFQEQHTQEKLITDQQLQEKFPDLLNQIEGMTLNATATNSQMITRIDMTLEQKQIGNNAPASGIRIFEEHKQGQMQRTRQSNSNFLNTLNNQGEQANYQLAPSQLSIQHIQHAENGMNSVMRRAMMQQRKDSMTTLPIDPNMSPLSMKKFDIQQAGFTAESIIMGPPPVVLTPSQTQKQRELIQHIEQIQKAQVPRNPDQIRFLTRQNTESLNAELGGATMQKVIDIQDNLNVPIEPSEKNDESRRNNGSSVLDQIDTLQDTMLKQMLGNKTRQFGNQAGKPEINKQNEDLMTIEQRNSALSRYLDIQGNSVGELRITTTAKPHPFSLTNNMMSLRLMQVKESAVFPMEAPPLQNSERFTNTQFSNQLGNLIDTNAKFNLSMLSQTRNNVRGSTYKSAFMSPTAAAAADLQVKINHRMVKPTSNTMSKLQQTQQKVTIAERIQQVKNIHNFSGTPKLSNQKYGSGYQFGSRSRSIDPNSSIRVPSGNPFNLGSVPVSMRTSGQGSLAGTVSQNELVKRFKNISDREAPASHISDKVYEAAQNQSNYNNVYSFVGRNTPPAQSGGYPDEATPPITSQRLAQTIQSSMLEKELGPRNKYEKRKLSCLERPTQLEIGGEGSPMLSLLPPLRTREISPRYNFTVGKQVKDQFQRNLAGSSIKDQRQQDAKNRSSKKLIRNREGNLNNGIKSNYVKSTKIIVSDTGKSPHLTHFNSDLQVRSQLVNQISSHPVMIKAVSKTHPLYESEGVIEEEDFEGRESQDIDGASDAHMLGSGKLNDYRDIYLLKQDENMLYRHPGPLDVHPMDASLNEKLALMASKVYKNVVVPLEHLKEDDPVAYERRQLNLDGTWKEQRNNQRLNPGFHFLEYASKNFRNPVELITASNPGATVGQTVASVQEQQDHQMYTAIQHLDHPIMVRKPRQYKAGLKTRHKRHQSSTQDVNEKFSLKVQKKPINGLQHIKVEQAQGPGGNKLYSIKVKQKSPNMRRIANMKDSIEGEPLQMTRKETFNLTQRGWDEYAQTQPPEALLQMQQQMTLKHQQQLSDGLLSEPADTSAALSELK